MEPLVKGSLDQSTSKLIVGITSSSSSVDLTLQRSDMKILINYLCLPNSAINIIKKDEII
jgi:hypothetical protein